MRCLTAAHIPGNLRSVAEGVSARFRGSIGPISVVRAVLPVVFVLVASACDRSGDSTTPTAASDGGIAYVVTNNCLTDVSVVIQSADDDSAIGSPQVLRDGETRTFDTEDQAATSVFVVSWARAVSGGLDARFVPGAAEVELTGSWCPAVE